MTDKRKLKICLAASAGGHLSQLLKLEPAWREYAYFFVTTNSGAASQLERDFGAAVYVVIEANRDHPLRILQMLFVCARIVVRELPDVVISTGAAPGCLLSFLGKIIGARVVWVDSLANVDRISLSGRLVRPLANVFLTQWADLANSRKRIEYVGELV